MLKLLILLGILLLVFFILVASVSFEFQIGEEKVNMSYKVPEVRNFSARAKFKNVSI